jgi:esterase/lipase/1-acyl-sn-glycerol-3-phosphate acyltransferase
MNPFAYRTTGLAIKTLENLSKARVNLHGTENLPRGATIFVMNHFTRLETFLMPYYLHKLTRMPVWSIAAAELFVGALGRYLESVGAVSTKHPDRDRLIVKSLLTSEADWIIFPEGRMVKSKKIIEKGRYMISFAGGKHPPHTGAAVLALRTEFYRQRILQLSHSNPEESHRLLGRFNVEGLSSISRQGTAIVPVNITYYPLRSQINLLNHLAERLVEELPERVTEELMTEGAMLLSGVDIDIRLGKPIDIAPFLTKRAIVGDIRTPRSYDFDDPLACLKQMRRAALKIMKTYMDDIYGLTTINHDHIFASLIKHSVKDRIDKEDFSRRAFLAITRKLGPLAVHTHHSLDDNQSHLLIDDRFGKLSDFIKVAEEKGVIELDGTALRRNRSKMGNIFDYDRVRIDNPIAVIANEVEPLKYLQKRISRLSRTPGWILRKRIAALFKAKAEKEFEADYAAHFIPGETKPRTIGQPVLLRGRSRKVGIVLCHGYMAAPAEVRTLADHLASSGYWVYTPRLKGHGTSPEDLAQSSYQEWIHAMEDGYILMRQLCRRVILGGFSTGAAVALELASRLEAVSGVFAVSTPLRLQYLGSKFAPLVDTWNKIMGKVRLDEIRKEFVDNQPENPRINYLRNPISGVRELERLMDVLEPKLPEVTIPALVVQGSDDPVVNPAGSERVFKQLGSVDKEYRLFNFQRHGILLGEGSDKVHRAITEFVGRLAAG